MGGTITECPMEHPLRVVASHSEDGDLCECDCVFIGGWIRPIYAFGLTLLTKSEFAIEKARFGANEEARMPNPCEDYTREEAAEAVKTVRRLDHAA